MPNPRKGETEEEFVARCIPEIVAEGVEQDKAVAMCHSMYEEGKKHYDEPVEYYTSATSFAEYDAQEEAKEAVEEIEDVTKLFGAMVWNITHGFDIENRVSTLQNLMTEYESR